MQFFFDSMVAGCIGRLLNTDSLSEVSTNLNILENITNPGARGMGQFNALFKPERAIHNAVGITLLSATRRGIATLKKLVVVLNKRATEIDEAERNIKTKSKTKTKTKTNTKTRARTKK